MRRFKADIFKLFNEAGVVIPPNTSTIDELISGPCETVYRLDVSTTVPVTIRFTPVLQGFANLIDPNTVSHSSFVVTGYLEETISENKSYIFAIDARSIEGGNSFTSNVTVSVTDVGSGSTIFSKFVARSHTDDIC